jgi:ABC-2 type transport system permease protein
MKTLILAKRELVERVFDKKFLYATILTPAFFGAVLLLPNYLANRKSDKQVHVAVIDASGLGMIDKLREELKDDVIGGPKLDETERLELEVAREEVERAKAEGRTPSPEALESIRKAADTGNPGTSESKPRFLFEVAELDADVPAARPLREQTDLWDAVLARAVFDRRAEEIVKIKDVWNPAKSELKARVETGELEGYFAFPPVLMEENYYHFFSKTATNQSLMGDLNGAVGRAVRKERLKRAGLDEDAFRAIISWPRLDPRALLVDETTGAEKKGASAIGAVMAMFLLYIMTILYGTNIMNSVLEDKQSRVAEVMLSTVTARQFLLGKIIGVGLAGTFQFMIWTGLYTAAATIFPDILDSRFAITLDAMWITIPSFVIGFTIYATLYSVVGALSENAQDAQQLQWPVVMMLMFPMLLVGMVIQEPNSLLSSALTWIPFTAPLIVPLRVAIEPMLVTELLAIAAFCAAFCLLLQWLGGRVFRATILSHGQKPSFRQFLSLLARPEAGK